MSNSRNSVSRGILIGQCNMAYNRIVKQGSHGSWKTWKQSGNFIVAFSRGGPESPGTRLLVQESAGNILNSRQKYEIYGRL